MKLNFPLAVIDFEACSLDSGSYPIEVGIAIAPSPVASIEIWSTLIRPHPSWDMASAWSRASAKVHGIEAASLAAGTRAPDHFFDLVFFSAVRAQRQSEKRLRKHFGSYIFSTWLHLWA